MTASRVVNLNKAKNFVFVILTFTIAMLPSGTVGPINVKFLSAVMAFLVTSAYFMAGLMDRSQIKIIALAITMPSLVGIWFIIGLFRNNIYAFVQFQGFFVTIVITLLIIGLFKNRRMESTMILRSALLGNLVYCLVKIILTCLVYGRFLSFDSFISFADFFGVKPITLEILPGLIRTQTISDALSPFILFLILSTSIIRQSFRPALLLVFAISIFLSYSRVIWAVTFLAAFLGVVTGNYVKFNIRSLVHIIFSLILIVLSLYFLSPALSGRFDEGNTLSSDMTRSDQIAAIMSEFSDNMFIGNGLGSYSRKVVRDVDAPFTYEVQWLSFLMQFGVIGVFMLILPLIYGILYLFKTDSAKRWLVLYISWLLMSFTNPYITSSVSALVFVLCFLSPNQKRRNNEGYSVVGNI